MVWCLEISENSELVDPEREPLAVVKESRQKKRNKKGKEEMWRKISTSVYKSEERTR